MSKIATKVYMYAGPWFAPTRVVASKAWRNYGKVEPPSKTLGWARLNQILSSQIKSNIEFNAQKKREEEDLRRKLELLKKKEEQEYFRCYMAEEVEEFFPPQVNRRTREWVEKVPAWTREAGTKCYKYDGPWHAPAIQEAQHVSTLSEEGFLARNGWVFNSTRYLARELLLKRMRGL